LGFDIWRPRLARHNALNPKVISSEREDSATSLNSTFSRNLVHWEKAKDSPIGNRAFPEIIFHDYFNSDTNYVASGSSFAKCKRFSRFYSIFIKSCLNIVQRNWGRVHLFITARLGCICILTRFCNFGVAIIIGDKARTSNWYESGSS